MKISRTIKGLALGFAGSLLVSLSCGSDPETAKRSISEITSVSRPTGLKVLLIGVDGASPQITFNMIENEQLPHLGRLANSGSQGTLRSEPPIKSPAIWTTMVTGRSRDDHGIERFVEGNLLDKLLRRMRLVSSSDREVSTLWNWMDAFGLTVGFQGWWASWPAEAVGGWIISDRLTRSRWREWTEGISQDGLTYPAELANHLLPLVVDPMDPPMEEVLSLVELTDTEQTEFIGSSKPVFAHGLSVFKFAYCNQRSYEEFALHMLDRGQPDLTGIFLIANDPISHTFWHYYEPEHYDGVDLQKASRLGELIPAMYGHNDRFIGRLLNRIDPDTVVIVVSDHGFQSSGVLPEEVSSRRFAEIKSEAEKEGTVAIGQSGRHHPDGILIAAGPVIQLGVDLEASIYDITPTVLALLGLPVGEDMKGRVLTEMIDPDFLTQFPIQYVESYDHYFNSTDLGAGLEVGEEEALEQLRALGYID